MTYSLGSTVDSYVFPQGSKGEDQDSKGASAASAVSAVSAGGSTMQLIGQGKFYCTI